MEIQRQRWRSSLFDTDFEKCEQCGHGYKRSIRSCTMEILRVLEGACFQEKYAELEAQVPEEIGTYLLNNKRDYVHQLELATNTSVVILPAPSLGLRDTHISGYRHTRGHRNKNATAQLSVKPWMSQSKPPYQSNKRLSNDGNERPLVTRDDVSVSELDIARAKRSNRARTGMLKRLLFGLWSALGLKTSKPTKKRSKKKGGRTAAPQVTNRNAKGRKKTTPKKKGKSAANTAEPRQSEKRDSRRRRPQQSSTHKDTRSKDGVTTSQQSQSSAHSEQRSKKKNKKHKEQPEKSELAKSQASVEQPKRQNRKPQRKQEADSQGTNQKTKKSHGNSKGSRSRKRKQRNEDQRSNDTEALVSMTSDDLEKSFNPQSKNQVSTESLRSNSETSDARSATKNQSGDAKEEFPDAVVHSVETEELRLNDESSRQLDLEPGANDPEDQSREDANPTTGIRRAANDPRHRTSSPQKQSVDSQETVEHAVPSALNDGERREFSETSTDIAADQPGRSEFVC